MPGRAGLVEDRYETRLRAMIDAKLKGKGIDQDAVPEAPTTTNVIDLMAALKRSVAASEEQPGFRKVGRAGQDLVAKDSTSGEGAA